MNIYNRTHPLDHLQFLSSWILCLRIMSSSPVQLSCDDRPLLIKLGSSLKMTSEIFLMINASLYSLFVEELLENCERLVMTRTRILISNLSTHLLPKIHLHIDFDVIISFSFSFWQCPACIPLVSVVFDVIESIDSDLRFQRCRLYELYRFIQGHVKVTYILNRRISFKMLNLLICYSLEISYLVDPRVVKRAQQNNTCLACEFKSLQSRHISFLVVQHYVSYLLAWSWRIKVAQDISPLLQHGRWYRKSFDTTNLYLRSCTLLTVTLNTTMDITQSLHVL